jgi:hypothetical protein
MLWNVAEVTAEKVIKMLLDAFQILNYPLLEIKLLESEYELDRVAAGEWSTNLAHHIIRIVRCVHWSNQRKSKSLKFTFQT